MKERPILFSGQMVRAILAGRKTQTRRIVKPHPAWVAEPSVPFITTDANPRGIIPCPYGATGDRLWVRETWQDHGTEDRAHPVAYRATWRDELPPENGWRPSIHMPRWASRITLEIVAVRVDALNHITERDAEAEGVTILEDRAWAHAQAGVVYHPNRSAFKVLWESINGKGSWNLNPWVWVIEFKKI